MSRESPSLDEQFGVGAERADAESQQPRRPTTKQLRRVLEWLHTQGLDVIGPNVDLEDGRLGFGNRDYDTVEQLLLLAKLNKKYPDGIPRVEED
jgi:hypothetical protein